MTTNDDATLEAICRAVDIGSWRGLLADIKDGLIPNIYHGHEGIKLAGDLTKRTEEIADLKARLENATRYAEECRVYQDRAIARAEKAEVERDAIKSKAMDQKPFLYAKADKYGYPVLDEMCVAQHPDLVDVGDEENILPLYTGPQVIYMQEQRDSAIRERDDIVSNLKKLRSGSEESTKSAILTLCGMVEGKYPTADDVAAFQAGYMADFTQEMVKDSERNSRLVGLLKECINTFIFVDHGAMDLHCRISAEVERSHE